MKFKIRTSIFTSLIILASSIFTSAIYSETQRIIPPLPETESLRIEFNGDSLKVYYMLLDFRTPEEKKIDTEKKSLAGDLIVFTHGHAQRTDSSYTLTSKLAASSKSGIVIIPICDTPFGTDPEWRGDRGKNVILMEITRHVLAGAGIAIKNYKPITDLKVTIDKKELATAAPDAIQAELDVIGWSHGSILARNMAHSYPDSINSMVQMTPAGYTNWGGEYVVGPSCLMANFAYEGACIGGGFFRGEGSHVFDSGWGVAQGMFGDTGRSCGSCFYGNFSCLKPFRNFMDTKGCTLYTDDNNLPVAKLKNITVIYGSDDSLFKYDADAGIRDPKNITQEEKNLFFEKYYPSAVKSGAKCTLAVLPGNHIGPVVYSEQFVDIALTTILQKK